LYCRCRGPVGERGRRRLTAHQSCLKRWVDHPRCCRGVPRVAGCGDQGTVAASGWPESVPNPLRTPWGRSDHTPARLLVRAVSADQGRWPARGWLVGGRQGGRAAPTNRGKLDIHGGVAPKHEQLVNAPGRRPGRRHRGQHRQLRGRPGQTRLISEPFHVGPRPAWTPTSTGRQRHAMNRQIVVRAAVGTASGPEGLRSPGPHPDRAELAATRSTGPMATLWQGALTRAH
jgi:hypothetical protein